jgi:hypothetical protein
VIDYTSLKCICVHTQYHYVSRVAVFEENHRSAIRLSLLGAKTSMLAQNLDTRCRQNGDVFDFLIFLEICPGWR